MKATIDRIDEGFAVLISAEEDMVRITVPVSLLPADAKEGDSIMLLTEMDEAATSAARVRVTDLLDKLKKKK
jgi:hypothetical protein